MDQQTSGHEGLGAELGGGGGGDFSQPETGASRYDLFLENAEWPSISLVQLSRYPRIE